MEAKKLVIIFSGINKALAFEWMAESIDRKKFDTHFILLNNKDTVLENFLKKQGFPVTRIPFKKNFSFLSVILKLFFFFRKNQTDIVHCHLFEASLAGLTAAWLAGVKKRIYTRHHSTLQHTYFKKGVKYDKWCNRRATHIVAVSKIVEDTLIRLEGVDPEKITIVYHGLKSAIFENVSDTRILKLKEKYRIPDTKPVIGIISRYLHLKGITYAIEAFAETRKLYPEAFLILANASGDYKDTVKATLNKIPPSAYCEIEFEEDLPALYRLFDIFIHVPIDEHSEAFGQTYTEALASGVPSVFTISGVAAEFIRNNENAMVVDYKNSLQIYEAIKKMLSDEPLRMKLIQNGKNDVRMFDVNREMKKLESLYLN